MLPTKSRLKRLRTIEEAGKQAVPFTTGILIGIGETLEDRVDTLLAIRDLHRRYGHIQEVIIQNFRVKPEIPMRNWPEPTRGEMLRTVAVARLLMPDMNIQAPPNLSEPYYDDLLDAGINDWGGVSPLTPDFINPERPWPHLEQLKPRTEARGFELRQRLPVYPEFLDRADVASRRCWPENSNAAAGREGYAGGPHDRRTDRRHRRREVRGWTRATSSPPKSSPSSSIPATTRVVGTVRFARRRFHHLCSGRNAEQRARLGREGRHFLLPAGNEANWASRSGFTSAIAILPIHLLRTKLISARQNTD